MAGEICNFVSGAKLRRANRYQDKVDYFENMRKTALSTLRFRPVVDPVHQAIGGNLAFNF